MIMMPSTLRSQCIWSDLERSSQFLQMEATRQLGVIRTPREADRPHIRSFDESRHLLGLPGKASGRVENVSRCYIVSQLRVTAHSAPAWSSYAFLGDCFLGKLGPLRHWMTPRDPKHFGGLLDTGGDQSILVRPEAAFLLACFHPVNKFSTKERAGVEGLGALGGPVKGLEFPAPALPPR